MFERHLYDYYQLYCDERFVIQGYDAFEAAGNMYLFFPVQEASGYSPTEQVTMVEHLQRNGDITVAELIWTIQNEALGHIDGQEGYLYKLPSISPQEAYRAHEGTLKSGEELSFFHERGEWIQLQNKRTYPRWNELWSQRLKQLEDWYQQVVAYPQTEIDEAFIFTFPYFMGLCENAIQYVVDTDLDEQHRGKDSSVVCHQQFTDYTWLCPKVGTDSNVKLPAHFIVDHPSRDLAEWIRHSKKEGTSFYDIQSFMYGYEQYRPLSRYGWRMLYSRLLFPLHYFVTIEGFYRSKMERSRSYYANEFLALLEKEKDNELFLQRFLDEFQLSSYQGGIPKVNWL